MQKQLMGRHDDLLTHAEAAKRLDVTTRHLSHMVRQGHIQPAVVGKRLADSKYREEDVNALLTLKTQRVTMPQVASLALRAHCLSLSTAERLAKICVFLGLENNQLRLDEDSVFELHVRVQDALSSDLTELGAGAIMEWAGVFNALDEAYLKLLEGYTQNASPWEPYLKLATALMAQSSAAKDANERFAYTCLDGARRNLRHVSYFYVLTRSGARMANDLFIDEVDEEVIAQLYPTVLPH